MPTFTPTPAQPTATAILPTETPVPPPTAIPATEEPTPEPTSTTEVKPSLTVANATVNVRSGPGTAYPTIGSVQMGQQYEVTGKNPAGDWWEFDFNGQRGWVIGRLVTVNGAATEVAVAQNVAAPPTARPQPTAAAQPPAQQPTQPTQPPAASEQFAAVRAVPRVNTNNYVTVFCRVNADLTTGNGTPGTLRVMRDGAQVAGPKSFGGPLHRANTGMGPENEFMYNENCKLEVSPFVAGTYTAHLLDGGGNPISEPLTFTADGDTREFLLEWKSR